MSTTQDLPQILLGDIRLDRRAGEVYRNGLKITLPEQLFRLLVLLAERPGDVVTREEIRKNLWSDTFVNFDDSINSAIRRLRHYLEGAGDSPQLIETLPGHGYRLIVSTPLPEATLDLPEMEREPAKPRLAVLPFDNLSVDPAEACTADSLTDAVTTALAKIPALNVTPRCLVMGYKQLRHGLAATGKKLKVDNVLQGSFVRFGDRLRVTVQLLNVAKEEHLWAESYHCSSDDIIAFQLEVAENIAAQVTERLAPAWKRRVSYVTPMRVAHDAHLTAHHHFITFTNTGFWKARHYWKKAVHEDPSYPQAYAGLAESYNMLGMTGLLDATDALEEARAAARRALQIDETLAEAHSALAHTYAVEWNWASASREFSHALQLDPALTVGNPCHYVEFLMAVKDPKQASMEIERIPVARPISNFWGAMRGWAHYGNRDYDRAIQEHQAVVKNDPRHAMAHLLLALDYSQKKQYRSALLECRKVLSLGKLRLALNAIGYVYAVGGERDRAKEILSQLRRMLRTSAASSYAIATIYVGLGDYEAALEFLERACDSHDPELLWLKWDPQLDPLRSYPRFQKLFSRIGLRALPLAPRIENDTVSEITKLSA